MKYQDKEQHEHGRRFIGSQSWAGFGVDTNLVDVGEVG